jgi:hypothetical protein
VLDTRLTTLLCKKKKKTAVAKSGKCKLDDKSGRILGRLWLKKHCFANNDDAENISVWPSKLISPIKFTCSNTRVGLIEVLKE